MRGRTFALVLLIVMTQAGCMSVSSLPPRQVYDGDRPDREIAIVDTKADSVGMLREPIATIVAVDDHKFGVVKYDGSNQFPSGVRVLPGKHVLTILGSPAQTGEAYGPCHLPIQTFNLWFVAEAGHRYVASYHFEYHIVSCVSRAVILDEATGQPVGGVEGSSDEPRS